MARFHSQEDLLGPKSLPHATLAQRFIDMIPASASVSAQSKPCSASQRAQFDLSLSLSR